MLFFQEMQFQIHLESSLRIIGEIFYFKIHLFHRNKINLTFLQSILRLTNTREFSENEVFLKQRNGYLYLIK